MPTSDSLESIKRELRALDSSSREILFPCISDGEVSAFESRYSILLPPEYRYFLTIVGNGGEEFFRLGEMDHGWEFAPWNEGDGFVGTLGKPFQYSEEWNNLAGYPEYDPQRENDPQWIEDYDRKRDEFDARYFLPIDGAIPIAHLGCCIRLWLIVTGPERGNVWYDDRANLQGLKPLCRSDGSRLKFLDWCKGWATHKECRR